MKLNRTTSNEIKVYVWFIYVGSIRGGGGICVMAKANLGKASK